MSHRKGSLWNVWLRTPEEPIDIVAKNVGQSYASLAKPTDKQIKAMRGWEVLVFETEPHAEGVEYCFQKELPNV